VDQLGITIPIGRPEGVLRDESYPGGAKQAHGLAGCGGAVDDGAGMMAGGRRGQKKRKC